MQYKFSSKWNLKVSKLNSGFSLIELLVVIVTMALLFGLGFANYRSFQRRQVIEGKTRVIRADLRLAQEMAIAGTKPAGCLSLDGYIFRRLSATTYRILARCRNLLIPNPFTEYTYKDYDVSTGATGVTMQAFNDVVFLTGGRGVEAQRIITLQKTGEPNRNITITVGGQIN